MPAIASFFLSCIICKNGEFEPTAADLPKLACRTIENFAKISLRRIAWNSTKPLIKEIAMIIPTT